MAYSRVLLTHFLSLFFLYHYLHGAMCENITWEAVLHDSFNPFYRSITGATTPEKSIKIRIRTAAGNLSMVRTRIWDDRINKEIFYNMKPDYEADTSTAYDWWTTYIPTGNKPTILYYFFELTGKSDGNCQPDIDYYVDDDPKFYGGGYGHMRSSYTDGHSFQITVYDPEFKVPGWMKRGIVYQIFPDRFRDGNSGNNPAPGRFYYGTHDGTIFRSNQDKWNYRICDPRRTYRPHCKEKYGENFYGGDLRGIIQKINEGYFDNLGVSILYLNPIFKSPSNHKYDTGNYLEIDSDFGTIYDFKELIEVARNHRMKIIVDGVFNHTSSDSIYFDYYSRFPYSGACEDESSPYRSWFYIPDIGNPARGSLPSVTCAGGLTYEAWFGYSSLPKLNSNSSQVRDLFWANGIKSVAPFWIKEGIDGWRLDVGGDVDPGLTNDPSNNFWEGFRSAIRDSSVTGRTDAVIISEEWGDASPWLLGNEWDSVMNYRLRSALLSWFFTGCSGPGCKNHGQLFEDNDSNKNNHSGSIAYIGPSKFNARLLSIYEDYPAESFKAMMNLEGSHDTNRIRFLLKKINYNDDSLALRRLREWWIFSFTYPGAPTIYYGDEVGLTHDGVFSNGKYEDDPYNRAPFPWNDTPGDYRANTNKLLPHMRKMSSIRNSYRALQDGDVHHGLIIDDTKRVYAYARTHKDKAAFIALNRNTSEENAIFSDLNSDPFNLSDGTIFIDPLSGKRFEVSGGSLKLKIQGEWGAVLLDKTAIDTPSEISDLSFRISRGNAILRWPPVTTDTDDGRELVTLYKIFRGKKSDFIPEKNNLIATVTPPPFGNPDGIISCTDKNISNGQYYYLIRAYNSSGKFSETSAVINYRH